MKRDTQPLKKILEYFVCENCSGTGYVDDKKCKLCAGYSFGVFNHNDFLYWGKVINRLTILQDKVHHTINQIVNFILFVFGIVGLWSLGMVVYYWGIESVFTIVFWTTKSWWLFMFWLSFMVDLYIYYRLLKESKLKYLVKFKEYKDVIPTANDLPMLVSGWEEVKLLDPEKKIDVYKAYHKDAFDVVEKAYYLAKKFKHKHVTSLHLLATLLVNQESAIIFGRLGISLSKMRNKISAALNSIEKKEGKISFDIGLRAVLIEAYDVAYYDKLPQVNIGDLLLVLARKDINNNISDIKLEITSDKYRKITREILYDLEIDEQKIRNVVLWIRMQKELVKRWRHIHSKASLRPKHQMDRAYTAISTVFLNQFCTDLTALASRGRLGLCVGREKEIKEVFRMIEGGKNGLILVGPSGVGKKSIIEGIAQMMVSEDVPRVLSDKRLVSLSIARLISNASPSDVAGRLMRITNEITSSGNIVLFVENIEEMGGLTSGGEQSIDASGVLAKLISHNNFITFATAKSSNYTSYIEQDSLGQVMHKVSVEEMDDNDTILVLESKASLLEAKHKVFFSYSSLSKTVQLTRRYVFERYLPEKAIGIIEEVAVYVRNNKGENSMITVDDVAYIISQKVNVPLTKVSEEEGSKLLKLEDEMHKRMIGQDEAVKLVSEALRRARAGLSDQKRPIANFLFLGPTGVGKTELAKTVAATYFGDETNMIRLDMSEYQEQSSIYRLIGSPGSKMGGLLTEAVRRNPFSLLLLDELEKAHPDILNVFLQVMDDGRLTDSLGRTISFTNIILIATSNAGTQFIQDKIKENWTLSDIKESLINQELKGHFRPEFLNRFDGIVAFKPLTMPDMLKITRLLLQKIAKRLGIKGINLEFTDEIVEELAVAGYNPAFGARPLRRVLQDRVDNVLAKYLLQNKLDRRDVVVLDIGGNISIKKAERF